MLKIFPTRNTILWFAAADNLPADMGNGKWIFIRKSMDYVFELIMTKDYAGVHNLLDKIIKYQHNEAGASLPSPARF
ncbi:MAG: hypothetical protein QM751_07490 [Paludibacteraceae bacterium]